MSMSFLVHARMHVYELSYTRAYACPSASLYTRVCMSMSFLVHARMHVYELPCTRAYACLCASLYTRICMSMRFLILARAYACLTASEETGGALIYAYKRMVHLCMLMRVWCAHICICAHTSDVMPYTIYCRFVGHRCCGCRREFVPPLCRRRRKAA